MLYTVFLCIENEILNVQLNEAKKTSWIKVSNIFKWYLSWKGTEKSAGLSLWDSDGSAGFGNL